MAKFICTEISLIAELVDCVYVIELTDCISGIIPAISYALNSCPDLQAN